MGPDSICGILPQTLMALLVIKEQVSNTRAIYLRMLQLHKNWITLQYVHNHPHIPRKCVGGQGQPGWSAIVTSNIMTYSSAGVSPVLSLMSASASDSPCRENCGASSNDVYSPWLSGEYISPKSSHVSGSITGIQQLSVVIYKCNLQAPRLLP